MKYIFVLLVLIASLGSRFTEARSKVPNAVNPQSAAASYKKHCASCHGKDGRSKTFKAKLNHARNLTDAEWQDRVSDERIFNSIMNGKGKMPGYSKKLSEQQIDALVPFVRAFEKVGQAFLPV